MRDDKHIARKGCGIGVHLADVYDEIGQKPANSGIEQGASQAAQGEVVGDQLAGRGEDAPQILKKIPLLGVKHGNGGGGQEKQADAEGIYTYKTFIEGRFRIRPGGG